LAALEGHSSSVAAVAWAPDGTRVITGGEDGTARVWDVETGETAWRLAHPGRVASVSFSKDGRQALTGDRGDWEELKSYSETRLWDLDSGQLLRTFEGGFKCEFSADGTKVRTTDGTYLNVFEASTGHLQQRFHIGWSGFTFSSDERFLVTFTPSWGGGDVGWWAPLYEADTGRLLHTLDAGVGWIRAAFWPGGDHVLTGSWDGVARLWSIRSFTTEFRFHPLTVLNDRNLRLSLNGATGQRVLLQRSANLRDWEDWQTVTFDSTTLELTDDPAGAPQRFYRAVEDDSGTTP
jgi:WD40 repeat protein